MRNILRGRLAAPAALLAVVAVIGLTAFWPSDGARAATNGPAPAPISAVVPTSTTLPTLVSPTTTPTTIGSYTTPGVTAQAYATANNPHSGITYQVPPDSFIAPGQALFDANCSSCHGSQAEGSARAPNLRGLGAGTVDFWVSTGRMPLADSSVQATRKPPKFNTLQTLEIATFVQSLTPNQGLGIPLVNLSNADLENGNSLFTLNCAACHTITGAGDALAGGAYAPSLHLATTTQIVEAMRSGPGNMPHFSQGNITDPEARDIAAYVHGVIQHPSNPGGFGLGGIGPVGEGFVGLLLGVGILMLVAFWIGERS
jgi:ubiquinol-cytochrome c reductase cytochrome c subunit